MTDDTERLQDLFAQTLQQPEHKRRLFLDEACGGNAEQRELVEGLLAAHAAAGDEGFLGHPTEGGSAVGAKVAAERDEKPGTVIGRYKLLELIGEGGFGAVYMAEQREPVRRKVALKIIKLGMDTKQTLARFEAERQALAMMEHANIATVLDAGATDAGRPYFVMELVKGVPVTEYCDTEKLSTKARLALFVDVCNAVQHAHQKGVIHRDIKPSNVMVTIADGRPVPKVIDFGIAKATNRALTDKTLFTEFRQLIGTPAYMSPEQAEMSGVDIDTRSDIYSLGVLLYELLTGSTPFDPQRLRSAAFGEMQRIIREEDPEKPSTRVSSRVGSHVSSLKSEPRTQVRGPSEPEAQARERSEPRPSGSGCSPRDAQASEEPEPEAQAEVHTKSEPEAQAEEPSPTATPTNTPPSARASGSDFSGSDAPGSSAFTFPAPRSPIPDPSSAITIAIHRQTDPIRLTRELRGDLDWIVMKCLDKDRTRRYQTANGVAADIQRHLMDQPVEAGPPTAAYRFRKFARRNKAALITTTAVAASLIIGLTLATVGLVMAMHERDRAETSRLAEMEQRELAEANFQKARDAVDLMLTRVAQKRLVDVPQMVGVRKQLLADALRFYQGFLKEQSDDPRVRYETAWAYKRVGDINELLLETDEAKKHWEQAIVLMTELLDEIEDDPTHRVRAANTLDGLAEVLESAGRSHEAVRVGRRAIEVWEALAAEHVDKPEYRRALAEAHFNLGDLLRLAHRNEEALQQLRQALALFERLLAEFPDNLQYASDAARSRNDIGGALAATGRIADAADMLLEAAEAFEKLVAAQPDEIDHRGYLSRIRFNLGGMLAQLGRISEAETSYLAAIAIREKFAADFPGRPKYRTQLADVFNNLGALYSRAERLDEAAQAFQRVRTIYAALAEQHPDVANFQHMLGGVLNNIALVIKDRGSDLNEARSLLEQAISHQETAIGLRSDRPWYRMFLSNHYDNLFDALEKLGEPEAAERAVRRALEIAQNLAEEFPDMAQYRGLLAAGHFNLGNRLSKSGRLDQAEREYRASLAAYERLCEQSPDVPKHRQALASAHQNIGVVLKKAARYEEAERSYLQAAEIKRKLIADFPDDAAYRRDLAATLHNLGNLYSLMKRHAEAVEHYDEGLRFQPDKANLCNDFAWFLATCQDQAFRDAQRAVELASRAVELTPGSGSYWGTLGLARYRAADFQAAGDALEKAAELVGDDAGAYEWFFLAMTRRQLGDKEQARDWYDRALEWMEKNEPENEELRRFRAEAAQRLGIKK